MLWEQNPVCCGEQKPGLNPALRGARSRRGGAVLRPRLETLARSTKICRDLCLMSRPYGLPLVLPLFWLSGSVSVAGSFRLQAGCRSRARRRFAASRNPVRDVQCAGLWAPCPEPKRAARLAGSVRLSGSGSSPAIGLCLGPGRSRALSMSRSRACPGFRARARFARLSCGRPMPRARGGGEGGAGVHGANLRFA
jgi:hypothetical protein